MKNYHEFNEYDERLLNYITEYTREVGVPPTVDQMVEHVHGLTSKSSVHNHLKKMVSLNLLNQKNMKGYYYPTSLEIKEAMVPILLLRRIGEALVMTQDPKNVELAKMLSMHLQ